MTHVEELIRELLHDQGWDIHHGAAHATFRRSKFSVSHEEGELALRCEDVLISSMDLKDSARLRAVHLALKYLFSHLPRYNVSHLTEGLL